MFWYKVRLWGVFITTLCFTNLCISESLNTFNSNSITGIYSSLSIHEEGDISGIELFIVRSSDGYYGFVQCGSGNLPPPFVSRINIENQHFSLAVPKEQAIGCGGTNLKGYFDDNGLNISPSETSDGMRLTKQKSFWISH